MRYSKLTMLIPCTLLFSVCTTVTPAYKDNGSRTGPCAQGGSDSVAQQSYDCRTQHHNNDITTLHPYLSDKLAALPGDVSRDSSHRELLSSNPFSNQTTLPNGAHIASVSTIPNRDVYNIPLHMDLKQGDQGWQDEVLMTQEGQCWITDDVRHLGGSIHVTAGTLRQPIENR